MSALLEATLHGLAALHRVAQGGLVLYGLHRLWILCLWARETRRSPCSPGPGSQARGGKDDALPRVTVQLPVYNERFVVARLIDAAVQLDWPADRLEIQILDDSTDITRDIVNERVAAWSQRGRDVRVVRRAARTGFKAGALAEGFGRSTGEFIAIFDADFLPPPNFLRRALRPFDDPQVGMVQARWGFMNADHSWLTRAQGLLLETHFRVEQTVRSRRGLFFNFNGTAGIWRRGAIAEAGGWRADTVTEDLDLSYRAQLAGWRFAYLDDLVVPSELPVTLGSFRAQQQRWTRGSMQTARRILPRLLRAHLRPAIKIEATAHLLGNIAWLLGAVLLATLYPAVICHLGIGVREILAIELPLLVGSSGALLIYFFCAASVQVRRRVPGAVFWLPALSIGLAPSIVGSVIAGCFARGGTFERTPKYGTHRRAGLPQSALVYHRSTDPYVILNIALLLYSLLPLALAVRRETFLAVPVLLLFPTGFGLYVVQDVRDSLRIRGSRSGESLASADAPPLSFPVSATADRVEA